MKNKIIILSLAVISLITLTACGNKSVSDEKSNESAIKFKESYESLNGTTNDSGKEHRTISIDEDNPYEIVEADKIVELMESGETFYVYFGANWCPWCRSVVEKSIEVAKKNNIDKIYYVDSSDIRDTLELVDGEVTTTKEGSDAYYKLLDLLENVLSDYSLYDEDNNAVSTNEKRIYLPNFIYVENGKAVKLVSGNSSKQTDSRMELTSEILEDEENIFNEFFNN